MAVDPFRPSFGVTPPLLLAGRDAEILAFGDALDEGPGAPGRATLYTGVRGIGKTVMLNEAEAQARQRGWVTVSETAVPGLIDRLTGHRLPEVAAALELSASTGRRAHRGRVPVPPRRTDLATPRHRRPTRPAGPTHRTDRSPGRPRNRSAHHHRRTAPRRTGRVAGAGRDRPALLSGRTTHRLRRSRHSQQPSRICSTTTSSPSCAAPTATT